MASRRKRKKVTWGARLAQGLQAFFGDAGDTGMGATGTRGGVAQIFDRSSEMMDVAEEVAEEQRGRVLILDKDGTHARWLLAQLRQQPPIPAFPDVVREGFFTLVRLVSDADLDDEFASELDGVVNEELETEPPHIGANGYHSNGSYRAGQRYDPRTAYSWRNGYGDPAGPFERIEQEAVDADLIVFLFAGSDGWTETGARLYGRLRALSVPVLPVAMFTTAERDSEENQAFLRRLRQWTGVEPSVLEMADWGATGDAEAAMDAGLRRLVDNMLALRPRLAVPLAQEVPFYRRAIATRIIRTGALMTGLLGAEPIPLLDLPLQVAVQWKVAMQLAAIYGRPGLDVRSREMVGTVGLNLTVRYVAQQLAKIVPGVGFLLSAALSGLSTVLLGRALVSFYEQDQLLDWGATKAKLHEQGEHLTAPLRASITSGVAAGVAAVQHSTQRVSGYGATLGQSIRQKVRRAPNTAPQPDQAEGALVTPDDTPAPDASELGAVTPQDAEASTSSTDADAATEKEHGHADPMAAVDPSAES